MVPTKEQMYYNQYMELALEQARIAEKNGEVPVGAVIVDSRNSNIISFSHNKCEEHCNPLLHAEMNVINDACKKLNSMRIDYCDIYVSLEPCPMCAQAISFARIRRVYFGAYDSKGGGIEHGPTIFNSSSCFHKPEIYGGIYEKESKDLLQAFFKNKRN